MEKDNNIGDEDLLKALIEAVDAIEKGKEEMVGHEAWVGFAKSVLLQVLDTVWRQHITALDALRQGIYLRGYAQKQPKQEYKREAFSMFETLLDTVRENLTRVLMQVQIQLPQQAQEAQQVAQSDRSDEAATTHEEAESFAHVGRNDPCPCGSGKKYKDCHGRLS